MTKNIVLCFDKNFIKPSAVLLKSIELSNKNEIFDIHIVTPELNEKFISDFESFVNKSIFNIKYYEINEQTFKNFPVRPGDHINIAAYYRILLPTILPSTIDTVLYLDGDIIVADKLNELWDTDISNYGAAVVPDIHYDNPDEFKRLGLNCTQGYFNSGFMLINLKYWRENSIQEKTLAYISNNPDRCLKHDQDALNYTLSGQLLYISHKYNYQRILLTKYFKCPEAIKEDVIKTAYTPCIIHYCDSEKPWHKECFHPLADIWEYVADKIPGLNFKITYKYKKNQKIKFIIKQFLILLHLKKKFYVESWVDYSKIKENILDKLN